MCANIIQTIREKQLMMLEKRLAEIICDAKQAGLECSELTGMVEALYYER